MARLTCSMAACGSIRPTTASDSIGPSACSISFHFGWRGRPGDEIESRLLVALDQAYAPTESSGPGGAAVTRFF